MRYGFAGVLLLAATGSAVGQTTTCTNWYNTTTCNTPPQAPGVNWGILQSQPQQSVMGAYQQGRAIAQERANQQAAMAQQQANDIEAQRQGDRNQRVGSLVAAGRCQDALTTALNEGDFSLAGQVKNVCAEGRK